MSEFLALAKAENFAIRITNAYKYLTTIKRERRISDQLYRSGTSIMANLAEAEYSGSDNDYVFKLRIALKEANESRKWLRLLYKTDYIDDRTFNSIIKDVNEIISILITIIKRKDEKSKSLLK